MVGRSLSHTRGLVSPTHHPAALHENALTKLPLTPGIRRTLRSIPLLQSYGALQSAGSTTASEVACLARTVANYSEALGRVNIGKECVKCFAETGYVMPHRLAGLFCQGQELDGYWPGHLGAWAKDAVFAVSGSAIFRGTAASIPDVLIRPKIATSRFASDRRVHGSVICERPSVCLRDAPSRPQCQPA